MKKFLIGGASLFAILSANNAMAAGYTCEDLIEYTSCNTGYYLDNGKCIENIAGCDAGYYLTGLQYTCPDGYTYTTGFCDGNDNYLSEADCWDNGYTWYANGCYKEPGDFTYNMILIGGKSCVAAPAGSFSPGGLVASATKCAAGTYQPQSAQASCITTPKGHFSIIGATSYTACPATGLTDKDGNTVVATTADAGGTSLASCHVGSDVILKDDKGLYHYKSNCGVYGSFDKATATPEEIAERCALVGGEWDYDFEVCMSDNNRADDQRWCESNGYTWGHIDEYTVQCLECLGLSRSQFDLKTGEEYCGSR